ncbi:MAG: endonuclease/exonuclease/phosphatase family protein [Bacteroidota bacterium]
MPFYQSLNPSLPEDTHAIKKILELREALKEQIPERTHSSTLLLATWNIRDFDRSAYGYRLKEAYYYLAEIISSFDLIAVQEIYKDLTALNQLMSILGGHWKYIFSDVTEGRRGNNERIAYLYDSRKVKFGGLAGELVLPPIEKKVTQGGETKTVYQAVDQIWRTPLICGFQAGWAKFMLCSVHVQWGTSTSNSPERIQEIEHIAKFLKNRTEDETAWARKLILLGDFNIFSTDDQTYQVLENHEFICPPPVFNAITNTGKQKRSYDQILLRERKNRLEVQDGGTFKFFDYVFKEDEEATYRPLMLKPNSNGEVYSSYKQWRTHQISDHLPLWVELRIDYTDEYLNDKLLEV